MSPLASRARRVAHRDRHCAPDAESDERRRRGRLRMTTASVGITLVPRLLQRGGRAMGRRRVLGTAALVVGALCLPVTGAAAAGGAAGGGESAGGQAARGGTAPGRPGAEADYLPADKTGYGTSRTRTSPVWFTLQGGRMSEVYSPDVTTPATRSLEFVVTDGRTFTTRDTDAAVVTTRSDDRSPTYRQVATDRAHRWQLT